ncbi:MAG: cupin domain-containing protein [Planctomycetes bacterium]|nr:cupin domain-containing protein [Planctomycetota bacterium]
MRAAPLLALALAACAAHAPPAPLVEKDLPRRAVHDGRRPVTVTTLYDSAHQTVNLLRVDGPVPLHRHEHSEETIYLLSGKGVLELDGGTRPLGPGDLVVVPRGAPHGFTPLDGPAVVLSIYAPAYRAGDRVPVDR